MANYEQRFPNNLGQYISDTWTQTGISNPTIDTYYDTGGEITLQPGTYLLYYGVTLGVTDTSATSTTLAAINSVIRTSDNTDLIESFAIFRSTQIWNLANASVSISLNGQTTVTITTPTTYKVSVRTAFSFDTFNIEDNNVLSNGQLTGPDAPNGLHAVKIR